MSKLINNTINAYNLFLENELSIEDLEYAIDSGLISESLLLELNSTMLSESNSSEIEKALNLKLHPDYAKMVNEKGHIDPLRDYGWKKDVDEHAFIYGHGKGTPDHYSAIKETLAARSGKHHNRNLSKHIGDDEVVIGDHYDGDILNSEYTINSNGNIHAYHICDDGKKLISRDFNKFVKAFKNPTNHPMFDIRDYNSLEKYQDKYSKHGELMNKIKRERFLKNGTYKEYDSHFKKNLLDPKHAKDYKYILKQYNKMAKNK